MSLVSSLWILDLIHLELGQHLYLQDWFATAGYSEDLTLVLYCV